MSTGRNYIVMQSSKNSISNGAGKINILGVNVTNIAKVQALNRIQEYLNGRSQHFIVTPNPEIILEATKKDEELWYILNHADLALADGVALKFAGWFYGKNIKRTTGADLLIDILKLAQTEKKKVAVFNWDRGLSSSEEIKLAITKKFPRLELYVEAIERDASVDFSKINQFKPDIIFCALGAPFQEKFIYYNLAKIPSTKLGLSVGGSFDFLTGQIKRAPKILRSLGLEWLWRLYKQPGRWRRIYRATVVFPFRFFIFLFFWRWFYRPNVVGMLYKKETGAERKVAYKILIVERVKERGHWQLPQGGTDGDSLQIAGSRELKEELNTESFKPVAIFKNLFEYKFNIRLSQDGLPTEYRPMKNQRGYKGQRQSLFIAEFTGQANEIKINCWEHAAWRWVNANKLIESVHPIRQASAKIFMEKFWETVKNIC